MGNCKRDHATQGETRGLVGMWIIWVDNSRYVVFVACGLRTNLGVNRILSMGGVAWVLRHEIWGARACVMTISYLRLLVSRIGSLIVAGQ